MFGWLRTKKKEHNLPEEAAVIENFDNPAAVFTLFTTLTGINFNQKEAVTTSKLIHFCREHGIHSFEALHLRLASDPPLLEALINTLTVNETYFFREMPQIHFLCERFSTLKRPFRILCAPGSTGEEPYTLAISLLENGIPPEYIEIVSIDINSETVIKALEGCYTHRSLHKCSEPVRLRYFEKSDERYYRIKSKIKSLVSFYQMNIFDDALFSLGRFDAVFSRNMLIYFDLEISQKAISRLSRLAADQETLFFFGHADIIEPPIDLCEHYEHNVKFYTLSNNKRF